MKLTKISLKGFKSFADRTEINLKDGITIIVGPNGSGKSNISDSLRWVLGEMSLKVLRGSKMEDVIYAGSENRRALGFAEVEIIIDNSDNSLPIEYNEVSIIRRLYKSGESNYFINQVQCRAKDIRTLFMDTGIGKEGYSIIGQGRIDEILSDKPEDRRAIFEEVAGIVKFRTKKEESERKLDRTKENIIRIEDILFELEVNYNNAKIDAEKTRAYIKLHDELKKIDISISLKEVNKNRNLIEKNLNILNQNQSSFDSNYSQINLLVERFDNLKNEIESSNIKLNALENEINEKKENINLLKLDIEKESSKINYIEDDNEKIKNQIQKNKNELNDKNELLNKYYSDREVLIKNNEETTLKINDKENELIGLNPKLDEITLKDYNLKDTLNKENIKYNTTNQELNFLENSLHLSKNKIEEIEVNTLNLKKELDFKLSELKIFQSSFIEIENNFNEIKSKADKTQNSYNISYAENNETKNIIHNKELELSKIETQYNTLKSLEENLDGYQKSVKYIIKNFYNQDIDYGIKGIVSDLFLVEKKYEVAIEIGLGYSLQNIVIENDSKTNLIIEELKQKKIGRATFLPLNRINGTKIKISTFNETGVIGIASELISYSKEFESIFNFLLGRTLIVENLESALRIPKEKLSKTRIITLDGQVINSSGSISGGYVGEVNSGLISRKNKISELSNIKDKYIKEIDELKLKYDIKDEFIKNLKNELNKNKTLIYDLQIQKDEKKTFISELDTEVKILKINLNNLNKLKEEESLNINNTNSKIKLLSIESKKIKLIKEKYENEINNIKLIIGNESKKINNINEEKNKLNIIKNNLENRISFLNEKISEITLTIEQYNNDNVDLKNKYENNINLLNQIKIKLSKKSSEINNLNSNLNKVIELKINTKLENESIFNEYYETQKKLTEINNIQSKLEKNISDYKIKISKLEMRNNNIIERLAKEYNYSINDNNDEYKLNFSITEAEDKIESLNRDIEDLGLINPSAIQSEIDLGNRLEFLKNQHEDLIIAKEDLEKVIKNIENDMSNIFVESLSIINKNFNTVYKKLFGGGNVQLKLIDENNVLNSGIDILITPSGKKMQTISLLSGGEKALTAIALLFAIQKIKPSPFCILDEIDAALDDVNIERFTKYLTETLNETQFIIVTHRKRTMEIGNVIYGVSINKDGVSNLISIKLEKN